MDKKWSEEVNFNSEPCWVSCWHCRCDKSAGWEVGTIFRLSPGNVGLITHQCLAAPRTRWKDVAGAQASHHSGQPRPGRGHYTWWYDDNHNASQATFNLLLACRPRPITTLFDLGQPMRERPSILHKWMLIIWAVIILRPDGNSNLALQPGSSPRCNMQHDGHHHYPPTCRVRQLRALKSLITWRRTLPCRYPDSRSPIFSSLNG